MVKKTKCRKATLNRVITEVDALKNSLFVFQDEQRAANSRILANTAEMKCEFNIDWKERALDLMLEQAGKTRMVEKADSHKKYSWWQDAFQCIGFKFHRWSGKYDMT